MERVPLGQVVYEKSGAARLETAVRNVILGAGGGVRR